MTAEEGRWDYVEGEEPEQHYDPDEMDRARLRMKGEKDTLDKEEDLFSNSDVNMEYQQGQEQAEDVIEDEHEMLDAGVPEEEAHDLLKVAYPKESEEGGVGSGRHPEQIGQSEEPRGNARAEGQFMQKYPMTEEAPDDIDSDIFGKEYDPSGEPDIFDEDGQKFIDFIDKKEGEEVSQSEWDSMDNAGRVTTLIETHPEINIDNAKEYANYNFNDLPWHIKNIVDVAQEDVSVSGPPVGDTIPANVVDDEEEESPIGETKATERLDRPTMDALDAIKQDYAGDYYSDKTVYLETLGLIERDEDGKYRLTPEGHREYDNNYFETVDAQKQFDITSGQFQDTDVGKGFLEPTKYGYDGAQYGEANEGEYNTLWDLWHGRDHLTTGMTGNDKSEMMLNSGLSFDDPIAVMMKDREDLPQELQSYLQSTPASTISGRPFDAEVKATEDFVEQEHPRDHGKFTTKGGGDSGGKHADKSEKDLVKAIKGGSKDWNDWGRNEKNEELYAEIEKRNQELPTPKRPEGAGGSIFRDDPDAVSKMEKKVKYLEDVSDYWKKIIKFPHRDYQNHNQLGDAKWYALSNNSANLRDARKKLEGIKAQQGRGTQLVRKTTYKSDQYGKSKPRFYYSEEPKEEEKPKQKLIGNRQGKWNIDVPMKPEHRQNLINDVKERINRLQNDKDKETAGKKIDKVEDMSDEQLSKFFMWMGGKPVYSEAKESEWLVHTITQGKIPVTLGEKADQFDAINAVKRMYFGVEDGFIDDGDILSAVKVGESIGYEVMSWHLLPRYVKAKLGEGLIRTTESEWSTSTKEERKEILTGEGIAQDYIADQWNFGNRFEKMDTLEHWGFDQNLYDTRFEDLPFEVKQKIGGRPTDGDWYIQESKKKAIEVGSNPNPTIDDSYRQFVEPTEAPTGKTIVDQTYGVSEPETPDGQDLTGITIGDEENKLDFADLNEDELEAIAYADEEIIEKTPPKIKYHYYKQYPFGRRAGKQNPFGEVYYGSDQNESGRGWYCNTCDTEFESSAGAKAHGDAFINHLVREYSLSDQAKHDAGEVSIDTMDKARVWWDNTYPERQWSDMKIGERQHAILAFLRDPNTRLSEAKEFDSPLRDQYGNPYPTPEGIADCTFCGKVFDNWDILGDHITIVHNDQGRTREFYGGDAPSSILNHPDWTGYAGEGGKGSGRKPLNKSEDPKTRDKAHIGWKNYGIDDYIDKAEKEYLEGNEWLNDPQEDIDIPRLRELEDKDRAGLATLEDRNEQVTLTRKYLDWTDPDKSQPYWTSLTKTEGEEQSFSDMSDAELEDLGDKESTPVHAEEGGLGSGKKDHQQWMRAIEEEGTYDFCDNCSMITEQVNHKCQMCNKRVG